MEDLPLPSHSLHLPIAKHSRHFGSEEFRCGLVFRASPFTTSRARRETSGLVKFKPSGELALHSGFASRGTNSITRYALLGSAMGVSIGGR
jgi:hypothetical protein